MKIDSKNKIKIKKMNNQKGHFSQKEEFIHEIKEMMKVRTVSRNIFFAF